MIGPVEIIDAGRFAPSADGAADYAEHLRVPALSVGTYSIPAGATDDQALRAEQVNLLSKEQALQLYRLLDPSG